MQPMVQYLEATFPTVLGPVVASADAPTFALLLLCVFLAPLVADFSRKVANLRDTRIKLARFYKLLSVAG